MTTAICVAATTGFAVGWFSGRAVREGDRTTAAVAGGLYFVAVALWAFAV